MKFLTTRLYIAKFIELLQLVVTLSTWYIGSAWKSLEYKECRQLRSSDYGPSSSWPCETVTNTVTWSRDTIKKDRLKVIIKTPDLRYILLRKNCQANRHPGITLTGQGFFFHLCKRLVITSDWEVTKTTNWISVKLSTKMGKRQRKNTLNFGEGVDTSVLNIFHNVTLMEWQGDTQLQGQCITFKVCYYLVNYCQKATITGMFFSQIYWINYVSELTWDLLRILRF